MGKILAHNRKANEYDLEDNKENSIKGLYCW